MKRYYFDYAAATPMDPLVEKAMKPYFGKVYGNPGALHWFGQEASAAVFKARDAIAKSIGANYKEIIFTGSATEANNLALRGVIKKFRQFQYREVRLPNIEMDNLRKSDFQKLIPKIIVSSIEHDSVLETARDLSAGGGSVFGGEKEGVEVVYLPVDKNGLVDLKKLKDSLDERTVLVSVMYVNNEVGTIQPISKISEIVRNFRAGLGFGVQGSVKNKNMKNLTTVPHIPYPLIHTDAVQAFNYLNCNINDLGVDLLTLSAQKIYGPKGIGALYARRVQGLGSRVQGLVKNKNPKNLTPLPSTLYPIVTGGSQQEYGLRGGTENVPGIVGFAKAVELADKLREKENKRLRKLQEYFLAKIKKIAPDAKLNGPENLENRNPNNLNFYFPSAQDLLVKLDLAGFAVSPGAACAARTCSPSHVLKALGYSDERATNSLRFTFGRPTTKADIDKLLNALKAVL